MIRIKWRFVSSFVPNQKNSSDITVVRYLMVKDNFPSRKTVAKIWKYSVSTINKIINNDLSFNKKEKNHSSSIDEEILTTYRILKNSNIINNNNSKCTFSSLQTFLFHSSVISLNLRSKSLEICMLPNNANSYLIDRFTILKILAVI